MPDKKLHHRVELYRGGKPAAVTFFDRSKSAAMGIWVAGETSRFEEGNEIKITLCAKDQEDDK